MIGGELPQFPMTSPNSQRHLNRDSLGDELPMFHSLRLQTLAVLSDNIILYYLPSYRPIYLPIYLSNYDNLHIHICITIIYIYVYIYIYIFCMYIYIYEYIYIYIICTNHPNQSVSISGRATVLTRSCSSGGNPQLRRSTPRWRRLRSSNFGYTLWLFNISMENPHF